MALPWLAMGIGAGLNLLNQGKKVEQEAADQRVAAETMRWSPWTHMAPKEVRRAPTGMESLLQGAAGGAMMNQMFQPGDAVPETVPDVAGTPQTNAAFSSPLTAPQPDMTALNYGGKGALGSPWSGMSTIKNPMEEANTLNAIKALKPGKPNYTDFQSKYFGNV